MTNFIGKTIRSFGAKMTRIEPQIWLVLTTGLALAIWSWIHSILTPFSLMLTSRTSQTHNRLPLTWNISLLAIGQITPSLSISIKRRWISTMSMLDSFLLNLRLSPFYQQDQFFMNLPRLNKKWGSKHLLQSTTSCPITMLQLSWATQRTIMPDMHTLFLMCCLTLEVSTMA